MLHQIAAGVMARLKTLPAHGDDDTGEGGPVIAAILLTCFALLAVGVYLWSEGFIQDWLDQAPTTPGGGAP